MRVVISLSTKSCGRGSSIAKCSGPAASPRRPGRRRYRRSGQHRPWRLRGIEIRGRAETVTEPHELIRIYPDRVIAWGLDE
jgi:hypothetical protein